jgi:hypothetical protein
MLGIGSDLGERHLMRPKEAFDRLSIDDLGTGPTFWRAQNDYRPAGPLLETYPGTRIE